MAKLAKDTIVFRWQPSVMELKDTLTIASQVYNKSTLAPIPFTTVNTNSYIKNNLIGKTTWNYETDGLHYGTSSAQIHGGQIGANAFVVDNSDSNIGYIICSRDDAQSLKTHKINLTTYDMMVSTTSDCGANSSAVDGAVWAGYYDYPGSAYIIDQDSSFLYILHKHRGTKTTSGGVWSSSGHVNLSWINKTSMGVAGDAFDQWHSNPIYLGKKGVVLFVGSARAYGAYGYTQMNGSNSITISKFNTSTKTHTSLATTSITETFRTVGAMSRPFDAGSDIIYGYWAARSDNSSEGYRIYKYEVNMQAETAAVAECSYDFGSTDRGVTLVRHNQDSFNHQIVTFTMDDSVNKYACFCVTELPGISSITLDAFKVHIFKINSGNRGNLIYKSTVNPGFRMRGIMPLLDDYTKFMIIGDSHSEVWTWNSQIETYVYTSTVNMQCRGAMVDNLNRLWVTDENSNVHLISNFSPLTIVVTPASSSYNYQGSVIDSSLSVSAYNIDNTRVAVPVRLVLEGSTYFTDDTQVKQITTSASAGTPVNIKITGTSFSRVLASVVV